MGLNEQKGNMYSFVTHTWNPIKGRCEHDCTYCYMHMAWDQMNDSKIRLDEKELKTNLGVGNFIFVGSSTDMWAKNVPGEWIETVLECCYKYPGNKYLFQSKNPAGFIAAAGIIRLDISILGTTIETNRGVNGFAPSTIVRAIAMQKLKQLGFKTMVTIEPIMDFDLPELIKYIKICQPEWVNIGADSKKHNLPEPDEWKVVKLINELREFTDVKLKKNLDRLVK